MCIVVDSTLATCRSTTGEEDHCVNHLITCRGRQERPPTHSTARLLLPHGSLDENMRTRCHRQNGAAVKTSCKLQSQLMSHNLYPQ